MEFPNRHIYLGMWHSVNLYVSIAWCSGAWLALWSMFERGKWSVRLINALAIVGVVGGAIGGFVIGVMQH